MNTSSGLRVFWLSTAVLLVFSCGAIFPVGVRATSTVEWIRGGGFEQGFGDLEVYRYPRFVKTEAGLVTRVEDGALSGHYSLLLPGLTGGGYRIVFPRFYLVADADYRLTFRMRSAATVWTRVELFSGTKNLSRQAVRFKKGDSRADFTLRASRASGDAKDKSTKAFQVVVWISTAANALIDDISLIGPARTGTRVSPWTELVPDNVLGIYGIGETGRMRVASTVPGDLRYRIVDTISDASLTGAKDRSVAENGFVDLVTARRGAYRVEIYAGGGRDGGNGEVIASRRYAVIDRERAKPPAARYGIAMEEHGLKTQTDARIQAVEFYRLASELGAGSVRIFSLAMPDIVSADGIDYDFSQIDAVLELCKQYDLDPLVELGSNAPSRLPEWLRTSERRPDTIDLRRGLATKELRARLAPSGSKQYLDLVAYERYLRRVFEHLGDTVRYFEIWNEPGHKFLPEDYVKIARLTRSVQREHAPHAKLVGYSSTKRPGLEKWQPDAQRLPGFLDDVLSEDRAESIDVLSYHSAHAFKFMEEGQPGHGDETGYVDLLRAALAKNRIRRNLPIWDTERGVPWFSHRSGRPGAAESALEVARRLPGIYAASLASQVERLFWFYMESPTSTIARPAPRSGFFDANLEPMPHLAAYDAMTEVIGNSRFVRRLERGDGLYIYSFENEKETILMAFNWRGRKSVFDVAFTGSGYQWLDIMGNEVKSANGAVLRSRKQVQVDGWPSYLVFPGTPASQVRVELLSH